MTEILDAVWNGFLIGFKYVGIAGGFIVGAYAAFLLAELTMSFLWKMKNKEELS